MKSILQQLCYLLIAALLLALAVLSVPDPALSRLDETSRPDRRTNPDWQGRSVADGACPDIVTPSEVGGGES